MTADERLSEALWHLREAKLHLQQLRLQGAVDSISAAVVVVEDEQALNWKRRIKEFAKRLVG